jgi:hypothetical protein
MSRAVIASEAKQFLGNDRLPPVRGALARRKERAA